MYYKDRQGLYCFTILTGSTKLSIQAFQSYLAWRERIYDVHLKGYFHLHVLRFLNNKKEMFTKVVLIIYTGCLVQFFFFFFLSFVAGQYGERIGRIKWNEN